MLDSAEVRIAGIERQVQDLSATVSALESELGGAPKLFLRGNRKNIRDRLHELENDREAVKIAQSALNQAEENRKHSWTLTEKVALFLLAMIGAATSLARLFGA